MADITVLIVDNLGINAVPEYSSVQKIAQESIFYSMEDGLGIPSGIIIPESMSLSINVPPSGMFCSDMSIEELLYIEEEYINQSFLPHENISEISLLDELPSIIPSGTIRYIDIEDGFVFGDISQLQDAFIAVISPGNGEEFLYGKAVNFQCLCVDSGTGSVIVNGDIKWYSSIDGLFYNGNDFIFSKLSLGVHTIEIRIKGYRNIASFVLSVNRGSKPSRPSNLGNV